MKPGYVLYFDGNDAFWILGQVSTNAAMDLTRMTFTYFDGEWYFKGDEVLLNTKCADDCLVMDFNINFLRQLEPTL